MSIKQLAKNLGGTISKNSPSILTGAAVAGLVTTAILAVRATPKALELVDDVLFERMGEDMYGDEGTSTTDRLAMLKPREIVHITWRCYIPAVGVGLASIVCIIGANSIHLRRNAALAGIYSLTETAFKEYQSKVTETIGKNKELKVRDDIVADRIKENPPSSKEVIITGKGTTLCYESISGRYFEHTAEGIRRVENNLNKLLLNEDHISLNDLYFELGLPNIDIGDELGWHINTGGIEFIFSSTLTPDERPCLSVEYGIMPKPRY